MKTSVFTIFTIQGESAIVMVSVARLDPHRASSSASHGLSRNVVLGLPLALAFFLANYAWQIMRGMQYVIVVHKGSGCQGNHSALIFRSDFMNDQTQCLTNVELAHFHVSIHVLEKCIWANQLGRTREQ